ncbi:hypothetical protein BSKO_06612 [Bryopsis sp. KO-2023]|nr:hypothetical protein BSKO_06612 [Bryopsis sp. KO-2023]
MGTSFVFLLAILLVCDRYVLGFLPNPNQNPVQLPQLGITPGTPLSNLPRAPLLGNAPGRNTLPGPFNPGNATNGPGSSSTSTIQVSGACGTAANSVTTNGVTTQGQFQFCGAALPIGSQLRSSILQGDVQATSNVLVSSSDVNGLADGLKVPKGVVLTKSTVDRDGDPDVVTMKGFALASITDSSNGQINKLVDVILKSVLPADLQNFDMTTQGTVTIGCSLTLSSTSTSTANSVRVSTNQDCETVKVEPYKMQQELRATLKNRATMTAIVTADADSSARRRSLKCTNCRPTTTYTCAFCWPKAVCKSVFWCRR